MILITYLKVQFNQGLTSLHFIIIIKTLKKINLRSKDKLTEKPIYNYHIQCALLDETVVRVQYVKVQVT